jgi:hypothetical protein
MTTKNVRASMTTSQSSAEQLLVSFPNKEASQEHQAQDDGDISISGMSKIHQRYTLESSA